MLAKRMVQCGFKAQISNMADYDPDDQLANEVLFLNEFAACYLSHQSAF